MKFLILTQYFPPEIGAPQVRFASLVRELLRLGHEVEVVTALPNHPTAKIFEEYNKHWALEDTFAGCRVHRVWIYAARGVGLRRLLHYLSFTITAFWGLWKSKKPDCLVVESPPLFIGFTAAVYSYLRGVPFVFNVADLWPDSVLQLGVIRDNWVYKWVLRFESWVYSRATWVNAVTEGIRKDLIEKKKLPPSKVLFLPNGVDTQLFRPKERNVRLTTLWGVADRRVVLYAGTIGLAQGLDVMLSAAEKAQEDPELNDLTFVLLGDGGDQVRLQKKADQAQLKNVLFWPAQSPEFVGEAYGCAWAGLVSLKDRALFEGARPSKILPIMACGKPIIYCGKGEGARLVTEARAGRVVAPENADSLVEELRWMSRNTQDIVEMGQNGRRFVCENMGWNHLVQGWVEQLR